LNKTLIFPPYVERKCILILLISFALLGSINTAKVDLTLNPELKTREIRSEAFDAEKSLH
jgi:hypothetical protein